MSKNIYLCSFCDTSLTPSAKRLKMQAKEFNIFKDIFLYNENMLTGGFREYFKDKLVPSRGFGYWIWKPYIILETMKKLNYGDILIYVDIGCHLVKNIKSVKRFNDYINIVKEEDILTFQMSLIESTWTKQDLFNYFNVLNDKDITETGQVIATTIFMKKTDKNISILESWLKVYYDDFSLADDTQSKIKNPSNFEENRHDQSIWSLLVKINNLHKIPDENYNMKMGIFNPDFPIQSRRDKVRIDSDFNCILEANKFYILKRIVVIILNKIGWWIPSKKLRDSFREKSYNKIRDMLNIIGMGKVKNICDENSKYQIPGDIEINQEELCPCYNGKKYKNCHGKNEL